MRVECDEIQVNATIAGQIEPKLTGVNLDEIKKLIEKSQQREIQKLKQYIEQRLKKESERKEW